MPSTPYEQMFDHALDFLKGWPSESALDFSAKLSANVTFTVPGGRVVHVNGDGEFEPGVKGTQMGIFLIQGSDASDVSNPGGNHWTAVRPSGVMSGLVATGSYELQTTEFDTAATYAPNDILKSPTVDQITDPGKADAGKLYKTKGWTGGGGGALTLYSDAVCGVVSRKKEPNAHGVMVLSFWPVYCPSASA